MQKIRLGRTEARVSAVGLGTWSYGGPKTVGGRPVGWSGLDRAAATRALRRAWERGIDHWDTADVYGDGAAEKLIGEVWDSVPRDSVLLASKVGWDVGGYGHFYHPDLIRRHLERSLELLRTDRLDLYYLHHCDFGPEDRYLHDAIDVLVAAREAGKVRYLGLSDWSCRKVARVARTMNPDVVQIYRNVHDDDFEESGLAGWVRDHDAGAVFFSPLKHGLLLGKYETPTDFPDGDMRNGIPGFRDARVLAALAEARRAVEKRFGTHPEPVLHALCGCLLADSPSASVLVGLRTPQQVAAAATLGTALDAADAAWVRKVYSAAG